jgi:hypothetical protein
MGVSWYTRLLWIKKIEQPGAIIVDGQLFIEARPASAARRAGRALSKR